MQQQGIQMEMAAKQAEVAKTQAETAQIQAETQVIPQVAQAKLVAALSNNLDDNGESADFERRAKIAEMMMKERDLDLKAEDIASNERIATKQMEAKRSAESDYLKTAESL